MSERSHRIAVMAGDGVGPELVDAALRVLDELTRIDGFDVDLVAFPNSAAHYLATGELLGEEAFERLATCDSLLFGAAGDPRLQPGLIERALVLDVSHRLDLSIGVRPAYLHSSNLTPLKGLQRGDIDLVIVRDTTEGELAIPGGSVQPGTVAEATASIVIHTRQAVDRTLTYAFELARKRRGRVSLVASSNVFVPHQLWERRFEVLGETYADIEQEVLAPDAAGMYLVSSPQRFDVIATTLLFGGILSDVVGALVGGIGLIGSVRFNPVTHFGLYEPSHGSAPKYTGLNLVSPMATLNAVAMLIDDLGQHRSATRLRAAIDDVLSHGRAGLSTRSGIGTREATDEVIESLSLD